MKTENAILAGLGIAIAGFFGYRYYKRKKQEKEAAAQAETPALPTTSGGVTSQPSGFSDYQKKVMTLQAKLGIAVDGSAGPQTNNTVKSWFPTLYATLGNVSSANVDQYIAAKKETAATVEPTLKRVKIDAYTAGSYTRKTWEAMQNKGYALVLKDIKQPAYYYNSVSDKYIPTGGYFPIKAGTQITKGSSILTDRGILALLPTSTGDRFLLITGPQVYVP